MSKPKVYLAGPMRGRPNANVEAFDAAHLRWTAAGWLVFSPGRLLHALGYTDDETQHADRNHLNHVFQIDFACLFAADAIAMLEGWERSIGATGELALAQILGLAVYNAETMKPLKVPTRPWNLLKEQDNGVQGSQRQ